MYSKILTTQELKDYLTVNGVETQLTDAQLEKFIDIVTKSESSRCGVNIEVEEHNYTFYSNRRIENITLPLSNVYEITKCNVNGHIIPSEYYEVDYNNGIIHFGNHYEDNYDEDDYSELELIPVYDKFNFFRFVGWEYYNYLDFNISYLTYNNPKIYNILKALVLDCLLLNIALQNGKKTGWGTTELTENDNTIKFDKESTTAHIILSRINGYRDELYKLTHNSTSMMI